MNDDTDWIKEERRHEREMASMVNEDRRRRRETITERVVAVSWAVAVSAVVATLAALAYFWQHDAGQRTVRLEQACIESGGTWGSLNNGGDTCLRSVGS